MEKKIIFHQQLDSNDCGIACLQMIAQWYGRCYSFDFLRSHSDITRIGVSMLSICNIAEQIGFRTNGYRMSWEQVKEVSLPFIAHWNQNHFVVVYKMKKTRKDSYNIYIADPAKGLLVVTKKDFLKFWYSTEKGGLSEGHLLTFEPTPDFYHEEYKNNENKLTISYLFNYLRPYKKFFVQMLFGMLTGTLISLILPFLTQSMVDDGIENGNLPFIVMILIAQLFMSIGQTVNDFIRSWIMLHVTTRVSIALISDFLIKLMSLPISFFDAKRIGDIMQRIGDHQRIQSFLTGTLISMFFSIITFFVYTVVMADYNIGLFGVFLLGSILYSVWVLIFLNKRRKIDYMRFYESSSDSNNIVQLISGMQEIKLNGCEKQKRWEWERIQIRLFKIRIKGMTLSQVQQTGAFFINQSKNILIYFIAAKAVVNGNMTLGTMMAVQYIIGQLNSPIEQFIRFIQDAQDAKISLERLEEIHGKKDEESIDDNKNHHIPIAKNIEINNLTFQYEGAQSPKVLDNISLVIPAQKTTAIVGTSGSGKTTLMKMLLGYYEPIEGEILLNGVRLNNYSLKDWRMNCGVVMQEGYIFSDSIRRNIGIIDENPDKDRVVKAASVANINEFIDSLPMSYDTKIGIDGHGLSSGQKQRILIARSVYKNPNYIFFDEATNSLDTSNEKTIMKNLNYFFEGRTVVIIAHRLSSVKDADQIIVMDKGKIIERGVHGELIKKQGAYYNLIKNQLELDL